jgi:hypothetical protein
MSKVAIIVEVTEDEYEDTRHEMGITEEAWVKLTGGETGNPELAWLGEIQDVRKEEAAA